MKAFLRTWANKTGQWGYEIIVPAAPGHPDRYKYSVPPRFSGRDEAKESAISSAKKALAAENSEQTEWIDIEV